MGQSSTTRVLTALAAGLALGAAGAAVGWRVWLKPRRQESELRYETLRDITALFGLQLSYKIAKGTYANDLDALLTITPNSAALKARLAAHVDLSTLAVVGNAEKFKIEANVRDKDRTLMKLKGPLHEQPAR